MLQPLFIILLFINCNLIHARSFEGNQLRYELSPYLLQHKNNPVWWKPWGEKAFALARKKGLPIILSIGYSTCHWCHVMERESFEDPQVAALMNKYFVAIKVDREERPDVDKIYMEALHTMGQQGGWPLTMFLTPHLTPIWGGTYFPKNRFKSHLQTIRKKWKKDGAEFKKQSDQIAKFLKSRGSEWARGEALPTQKVFQLAYSQMVESFESAYGGFTISPKFPPHTRLRLLMRMSRRNQNEKTQKKILSMINKTLTQMFRGGIYDHVGGGFHRYSTEIRWLIPHFEKMLYDNSLLALTYIEAFQLTKNRLYANVARNILDYLLRDMAHPDGAFYSAEDADSKGVEGLFYLWNEYEVKQVLTPKEFKLAQQIYGVSKYGNFEKQNILNLIDIKDPNQTFDPPMITIKKKLFEHRKKRVHPYKDDKILTAWNGLLISALAKAYAVLGDKRFLEYAKRSANFLRSKLDTKSGLKRRFRKGESHHDAYLDDYAYLIEGLIHLYEACFDESYLSWAQDLQARQNAFLWDKKVGAYRFARVSSDLIKTTIEFADNARPNSNGTSLLNLLRLYSLTYNQSYKKMAHQLFIAQARALNKHPNGFAQALIALDYEIDFAKEIAIVGDPNHPITKQMISWIHKEFYPNKALSLGPSKKIPLLQGKKELGKLPTAFVCQEKICKKPVNSLKELKAQLSDFKKLTLY